MSADVPAPTGPPLHRRTVGRAAGALLVSTTLLAGCDSGEPLDLPGLPPLGGEEPDLKQVRAALRGEQLLAERVSEVRRRHRVLRRPLKSTLAVHRAHVALLSRAVDEPDTAEPDTPEPESPEPDSPEPGSAGNGAEDGARPTGGRVPRQPATAVAALIHLERSLADEHVVTAMRSESGVLARVVAAMSAAAAQQAVALAPLAVRRGKQ